ncbi:MAG: HAD-IB family phosphatase [Nitrososphaerota archaeon]|jgi:HAD superfamily PSPase-like hydrolase|nr:HAD-IB family phosphatase [Nitrososphaerota archaeon]
MDGTLINENTWELIYRELGVKGSGWLDEYLAGKISYAELMKRDVESWISTRGRVSLQELEEMARLITVRDDARVLVNKIISVKIVPVMVTAGLDIFAKRVADELKIGAVFSNSLKVDKNNCLTGEGVAPVEPLKKDQVILKYLRENGINPLESFSVGDTEYDGSMFKVTRTGFLLTNGHEVNINMNNVIKVKSLAQIAGAVSNA